MLRKYCLLLFVWSMMTLFLLFFLLRAGLVLSMVVVVVVVVDTVVCGFAPGMLPTRDDDGEEE